MSEFSETGNEGPLTLRMYFSCLSINMWYIFILITTLKTSFISSTHKQKNSMCQNLNPSSSGMDIEYWGFFECTATSSISLEHMWRQLSQKSIRAGLDEDKQCRLWGSTLAAAQKFPFLIEGHYRIIVFLLEAKRMNQLCYWHPSTADWKVFFCSLRRDSENSRLLKKMWKFQNYIHGQVCHLCNVCIKSTIILCLWQNLLAQNFTEVFSTEGSAWKAEHFCTLFSNKIQL